MKKLNNRTILAGCMLMLTTIFGACGKFLDVVPENVSTIDNAFTMRVEAEKFLYTCYSYMPKDGDLQSDPAMLSGDEMWALTDPGFPEFDHNMFRIARGLQGIVSPVGEGTWVNLYRGLRDCNIFLENIEKVPDLPEMERQEWIAEVKFLKAWYHFYLVRMYGPVPIIKENLPIDVDVQKVKVFRDPVDSCFAYIYQLLDEAKDKLPLNPANPVRMLGRITRPIAYSLKAKVMVTAASPLFNGNADQAGLRNSNGAILFNPAFSTAKWDSAASACKQAIDVCHEAGIGLYEFRPTLQQANLTDTIKTQMSIRNAIAERWNSEIIWANTQSVASLIQRVATPNVDHRYIDNPRIVSELAPPLKIVEMFYSENGVPITEDKTWFANKYQLTISGTGNDLYIRNGYTTAALNFRREPRFYANVGFDGGVWYGQGQYNDANPNSLYYVAGKKGQPNGKVQPDKGSVTGYFVKKHVHFQNTQGSTVSDYPITPYPWPVMRLAQLYLMYAEALNESQGAVPEVHQYINLVRKRAGLETVQYAWDNFSRIPGKYGSKEGMRDIIQRETLIETAFEGQRFWEIRRWKTAMEEYRRPIEGWDIEQSVENFYYRPKTLFTQSFGVKDYFFPIREATIVNNRNLVQNTGW